MRPSTHTPDREELQVNYSVHNEINGTVTGGAMPIGHLADRVKIGRHDAGQHVEVDGVTI